MVYFRSNMKLCCSRAKTVNENLKMSAALLSRFDLVFILLDRPDELLDKRVSEHIMAVSTMSFYLVCGCACETVYDMHILKIYDGYCCIKSLKQETMMMKKKK